MRNQVLTAGLLAVVAGLAVPARSAPKYETVLPWRAPLGDADQKANVRTINRHVRAMVSLNPDPKKADFAYAIPGVAPDKVEGRALQALAVMSALPYLTKRNPDANEELFDCARWAARNAMARVLEVALPEYYDTVKKDPTAPRKAVPAQEIKAKLHGQRAYAIPILLMALEMYFAGSLEIAYDGPRQDRTVRGLVQLPELAHRGVARLTALLISRGVAGSVPGADTFDETPLQPASMFEYSSFGLRPELTCLHKSGFAFTGLRAAASMGLGTFRDTAFAFPWKGGEADLGKKRFLDRYADALFHCLRCVMEPQTGPGKDKSIGVGFEEYLELQPERAALLKGLSGRSVNVLHYRTVYTTRKDGQRILKVERNAKRPPWPPGVPNEFVYRYMPHPFGYGTYHTAQAGYVLLTAAHTLPMLLEGGGGAVGKQYPLAPHPSCKKAWTVTVAGRPLVLHLDAKTGPFTPLRVSPAADLGKAHWDLNQRVAQCLNFIVRAASRPRAGGKGEHELDRAPVTIAKATCERWEATLAVHTAHGGLYLGVCLYGYVKLGIAAGCPDTFGPWPYYADLCAVLRNDAFALPSAEKAPIYADREFFLLILTRGYRPLFGRDSSR